MTHIPSTEPFSKAQRALVLFVTLGLSAIPAIAVIVPRFLAILPGIIGLFGVLAYRPAFGHWPRFSGAAALWLGSVLLLVLSSALWAVDTDIVIERFFKIGTTFLGGFLLFSLCLNFSAQHWRMFQILFPLGVLAAGLLCVLELYGGAPIYNALHPELDPHIPFNLSYLNRSVVFFIFSSFPALACLLMRADCKKHLSAAGLLIALILAVLYETQSQSAQSAVILGVLTFAAFPYARCRAWLALAGLLAGLIFSAPWLVQALYAYVPPLVKDIVWFQDSYAASRLEIWNFVAAKIMERPLYGFGIEATRVLEFETQQIYHDDNTVLHPHNFALQIWIEFGAIGAIFFAAFLGDILRRIRHLPQAARRVCLPMLAGCLLVASTAYGFWQGWWLGAFALMFCYAAIIVSLLRLSEDSQSAELLES